MWTDKEVANAIKTINSYSREKGYPLSARKTSDGFKVWFPTRLGDYEIAEMVRGVQPTPGLYVGMTTDPFDRYLDDDYQLSVQAFWKAIARLKKKADAQMKSDKIHTSRDPDADNGIIVYKGIKRLGEVWKGFDKQWHHSGKSGEYGGFRTKKEALAELLMPDSKRTMDYQPFDGYPKLSSATELLKEIRSLKASLKGS